MSKFNSLLESHLDRTNLMRIRIKHDPAAEDHELVEYVGYVLEEDGMGNIVAIVPGASSETIKLRPDQYTADEQPCDDPLTKFKQHCVKFLMHRGYHDKITKLFDLILNANSVTDVEKVVGSCGNGSDILLDLYRDYVTNEQL